MMTARSHQAKSTSRSSSAASTSNASDSLVSRTSEDRADAMSVHSTGGKKLKTVQSVLNEAKAHRLHLHHARLCSECRKGNVDKVRKYIATNTVDINYGDYMGRRAIHLAAAGGHLKLIQVLAGARADLNVQDSKQNTPLVDALANGHRKAADLIANLGGTRGSKDMAAELCGAAAGAGQDLRVLCAHGTSVNAERPDGRTPLHWAATAGHVEHVRLLVELAANVNARDDRGSTPLQDALMAGKDACCAELLTHGAELGDYDWAGHLCRAAHANDVAELGRLERYGCAVNTPDAFGRVPLHVAASMRRVAAVNFLVEVPGIEVNAEDAHGRTPLDEALREEPEDNRVISTLLASCGARRGSGEAAPETEHTKRYEEVRAQENLDLVAARRSLIATLKPIAEWVETERLAVADVKGAVDDAILLERQHGAVLATERPELWGRLSAYAEAHFAWHDEAMSDVREALTDCVEGLKPIAQHVGQTLVKRFAALHKEHAFGSAMLESLYETKFRALEGEGDAAAGGGVSAVITADGNAPGGQAAAASAGAAVSASGATSAQKETARKMKKII